MSQATFCYETLELKTNNIYKAIDNISETQSTVLVVGNSGTGKEAICQLLHQKGSSPNKPYIAINCSSIPEELIESELFGHEAGAFTDAQHTRMGKFELANGGTIVLDEINQMDIKMQAKLLRVLENREFYRLGGTESIALEARIIATTNQDLGESIKNGTFREDLFYRLDILRLELPDLNDRPKDIALLADFFLNQLIQENLRKVIFSPEIYHFLCQRQWEGNIRELKNFVTKLYFLSEEELLTIHDLYGDFLDYDSYQSQFVISANNMSLNEIEKKYILHTMHLVEGNKSKAARSLKISLKTLRSKLKEYDYKGVNTSLIVAQKANKITAALKPN
ncbi:hypothetical protein BVY03_05165 [bacterium K02(2017)]|nr:hypothetical protein BVY03_05165 [bacterium K02(2017)]